VLTIGHSVHGPEEFLDLLRPNGIELLVDVRAHPSSRRVPHFNGPQLAATLAAERIAYAHAPELGGRRSPAGASTNAGWDNEQFRGYADHMASVEFSARVTRLLADARERRTTVMCAEAPWWRCHRRLLADSLLARGARVLHIDARGGTEEHRLTDLAVVAGDRVTYPPAQGTLGI